MNTITRVKIAEAVHEKVGITRRDAADIVDMLIDEIKEALQNDKNVKISSFGTFSLRHKTQRIGRNPKTGVEAVITARKVVTFKPSQSIRKAINS